MKPKAEPAGAEQGADILPWPEGAANILGVSSVSLQRNRAAGDAPKLYAVGERSLVTTANDLLAWIRAKEVPPNYRCRPPVRRAGRGGAA